jgi:hypothetical protein
MDHVKRFANGSVRHKSGHVKESAFFETWHKLFAQPREHSERVSHILLERIGPVRTSLGWFASVPIFIPGMLLIPGFFFAGAVASGMLSACTDWDGLSHPATRPAIAGIKEKTWSNPSQITVPKIISDIGTERNIALRPSVHVRA